jgi:hypothetical protein
MASYGPGSPAATDTPGGDESDSQQPEYELIDHSPPVGDNQNDRANAANLEPAYELVDHSPPPPDNLVIAREEARLHGIQRSWLLGAFIGVFVMVILSDIGLSAGLPSTEWTQLKPEIDTIRTSMFGVLLIIIGYYFGEKRSTGHSSLAAIPETVNPIGPTPRRQLRTPRNTNKGI